jgi:hypothetical protein
LEASIESIKPPEEEKLTQEDLQLDIELEEKMEPELPESPEPIADIFLKLIPKGKGQAIEPEH